jgi:hypothetical protein
LNYVVKRPFGQSNVFVREKEMSLIKQQSENKKRKERKENRCFSGKSEVSKNTKKYSAFFYIFILS